MNASLTCWGRLLIVIGALVICEGGVLAQGKVEKKAGGKVWSLRVYRYPSEELDKGFVTTDRGQLRAPAMPAKNASELETIAFIKRSAEIVKIHLEANGMQVPDGSLFIYDRKAQMLAARTTGEVHESIGVLTDMALERVPRYLTFSLHVMEADASSVREAVKEAGTKADHTAIMRKLEVGAKRLNSMRLETRSGQRATVTGRMERVYPTEIATDEQGRADLTQEMRPVGLRFEMEPVIAPSGDKLDVNYTVDFHYAPPTLRWEALNLTGPKRMEARVLDFHTANFSSATTMLSGMTKLLSVWAPEGAQGVEAPHSLQVAFLRGNIVPLLPSADSRAEQMLAALGEKVLPTPAAKAEEPSKPAPMPSGMEIRQFRVPLDFLARNPAEAAPADPFAPETGAAAEPSIPARMPSLDLLRERGISFPEGASASFIAATSQLIVLNTPENLDKLEAFLESIRDRAARTVGMAFYIVQGDATAMRQIEEQTAQTADHVEIWRRIENDAAQGKLKIVRTGWIETRSGQRARSAVGEERSWAESGGWYHRGIRTSAQKPVKDEKGGQPQGGATEEATSDGQIGSPVFQSEFEHVMVGTEIEVDPVIGPDLLTVDVNLSVKHDSSPPTVRQENTPQGEVMRVDAPGVDFHKSQCTTAVVLMDGMTRMVGLWKPDAVVEGPDADVLQAVFIKVDLLEVKREGE